MPEIAVVSDVDNDNMTELVVVANTLFNTLYTDGVLVFGDANNSWSGTRGLWNQQSYHITNINDDSSIPLLEGNSWELFNNYRQNDVIIIPDCK